MKSDARHWMIENIGFYGENNRKEFLYDCAEAFNLSLRRVQDIYKNLFRPRNNKSYNNVLENNNPDLERLIPGGFTGEDSDEYDEDEIREYTSKLAKRLQKSRDIQRIERKTWRNNTRVENALNENADEIKKLLKNNSLHTFKERSCETSGDTPIGIIHLTDPHFNEYIDLPHNHYSFETASERLRLLAEESRKYFETEGIRDVVIAVTGDLLNSDRREDEKLSNASNRSKASFLALDLLKQFIEDLNRHYNITVANVSGNESRISDEMGFSDDLITDNYDFTIFNFLRYLFMDSDVEFLSGDPWELVLEINGHNFLLTHGYSIKDNCEKTIGEIKGRYASRGIIINYVLFGHLHSARIGDTYARGSSLCGPNTYSERALNLTSRASQNIFIAGDSITGIKVDLQDTDNVEGYDIDTSLEAYNIKSAEKIKDKTAVLSVVV